MKIIEYKYHASREMFEFKWIDTSEKSEKTSDIPLPSFVDSLDNLKDIVIDACNLKPDTEVDILGIKVDPKRFNSCKFSVEVFSEAGTWKFKTRKIFFSQLSDDERESIEDFLKECKRYIGGERERVA
jgi:hypothetical protein